MSAVRRIVSRDNPLLRQLVRVAGAARERRELGVSLLEGIHLCEAWLAAGRTPRLRLVTAEAREHPEVARLLADSARRSTDGGAAKAGRAADAHADLPEGEFELAEPLFRSLSQVAHGVGIAFVVDTPRPVLEARIARDAVFLDGLQDPGNVGTILRSCAAAGIGLIITAPQTAECWSPKVLRAAMGAHVALDIIEQMPWRDVADRLDVGVLATSPTAAMPLWRADLRAPAIWVFGSEGAGLDRSLIGAGPVRWLGIPQAPGVESLNVASAVAVCLFEQRRQRGLSAAAAPAGSS